MAGLLFQGQKRASEDGLHAEQGEEIRGVLRDADIFGPAATAERHGAEAERREALEGVRVLPPVEEMVGVDGQVHVTGLAGLDIFAHNDKLLRPCVVRRAEQHVAHDGEDDDIGADAEGEGKKSGRAESRAPAQLTKCKAQFAEKSVHGEFLLLPAASLPWRTPSGDTLARPLSP
jgi:hypothetical protein